MARKKHLAHFQFEVTTRYSASYDAAQLAKRLGITTARCVQLIDDEELLDEYESEVAEFLDESRGIVGQIEDETLGDIECQSEDVV